MLLIAEARELIRLIMLDLTTSVSQGLGLYIFARNNQSQWPFEEPACCGSVQDIVELHKLEDQQLSKVNTYKQ